MSIATPNLQPHQPNAEPSRYFEVPGFGVIVTYQRYYDSIEYAGTPDDLLASGAVSAEMLVINEQSGPRVRRKDQDGHEWRVVRSCRTSSPGYDCHPYLWYRVTRPVKGRLDRLPFGWEAFAADKAWHRWDDAEQAQRPQLHLVIDNTRPEAPAD